MEAERRQVTILFTDMVGFTAFSEAAGEEASRTFMADPSWMFFSAEICPRRGIDGNAFWLPQSYAAAKRQPAMVFGRQVLIIQRFSAMHNNSPLALD